MYLCLQDVWLHFPLWGHLMSFIKTLKEWTISMTCVRITSMTYRWTDLHPTKLESYKHSASSFSNTVQIGHTMCAPISKLDHAAPTHVTNNNKNWSGRNKSERCDGEKNEMEKIHYHNWRKDWISRTSLKHSSHTRCQVWSDRTREKLLCQALARLNKQSRSLSQTNANR